MIKFLNIQKASAYLGVTPQTLRRWEKAKKITPPHRTKGGQRRYDITSLQPFIQETKKEDLSTIVYARVSSHDQKEDLERQIQMLEMFCSAKGWTYSILEDLGSGMNYQKRGLKQLLELIMNGRLCRLVITHKDRLLRFGAELIFSLCTIKGIEVVVINHGEETTFEEELANDVLEIITVFSAKLYGSRSHKNKQLMANLQSAVANV